MDDSVHALRGREQAVLVTHGPGYERHTLETLQKPGITRRPHQRTDLGTLLIELLGNMRAQKSRGSSQQDSQRLSSPLGRVLP